MFCHTNQVLLVAFWVSKGLERLGFEPVIDCTEVLRANHLASVPALFIHCLYRLKRRDPGTDMMLAAGVVVNFMYENPVAHLFRAHQDCL